VCLKKLNYRVSIKSFHDYKHLLQETLRCTSEEFQPRIIFQQDGAPRHWSSDVRRFLDATCPNRWIGRDGLTPWPPRSPDITPLDFFLWEYVKDKVFSTPVPDITKLKARNNRRFCYNNWRHVGEHVERNWLSIRRSPCNKRSTCWSVLMCFKKNSWVELHFEKKNVCIPRIFIVIKVCNQGKTLCSHCIKITSMAPKVYIDLSYTSNLIRFLVVSVVRFLRKERLLNNRVHGLHMIFPTSAIKLP